MTLAPPSTPARITVASARNLHLAAQGLLKSPPKKPGKEHVLQCIRQMSALQIDTISVVARSPYLVLWSRLGDYELSWLDELLEEGKLFEYWAHEACFLPIEDYYLYRHRMISPQGLGWKFNRRWLAEHKKEVAQVKKHIEKHGPCRSIDFGKRDPNTPTGWWGWKPEKRSLEVLFSMGELMIAKRQSFQRVYDLRERVHPTWDDKKHLPSLLECERQLMLNAIKALGCAKASWIADYFRMAKFDPRNQPEQLVKQGLLLKAEVIGWDAPVYIHPEHASLLSAAVNGELKPTQTRLLSPFDPVVWDRKRALELFDFDYRLECYTPAEKRRHGYFCLPILRNGRLIGRMDAKAHRQQGRFEIKALHWEENIKVSAAVIADVRKSMLAFAEWHGTPELDFSATEDAAMFGV